MNFGKGSISSDIGEIHLRWYKVVITFDWKGSYIPTCFFSAVNYDKNKDIGFHYRSVSAYYDIREIYCSGGIIEKEVTITSLCKVSAKAEFEHYSHISAVHL